MQALSTHDFFLRPKLQFSVLQLASWPALCELAPDTAGHLSRICALLARKPSLGILIPAMLDIAPSVVYALLETLYAKGHILALGALAAPEPATAPNAEPVHAPELPAAATSLLGKIRLRLTQQK
ncbi:MAG: hypothetical protein M3R45_02080 [Pseudomonadota bacterium]|nr:hypothetical protein [Pseudomonadota bacterium]